MLNLSEWLLSGTLMAVAATQTAQLKEDAPVQVETEAPSFNATTALANANQALNALTTAQGRFVQIDAEGYISQGEFFLSRPGRMRFEYDDPVPVTLVSDGTTVAFEDRDLETVERVPLASTPLGLILRRNADLAAHANILSVREQFGLIAVLISDKAGEADGQLELFFDAETYDLRKWETLDGFGLRTTVDLIEVEKGVKLSPRLFRIEDPEDEDDRDRR